MEIGEDESVEVREVVVDPLLPCFDVGGEVARQPLHRVDGARRADLGVHRGVAHIALHVNDSYRTIVSRT
eukprot:scaffold1078_cov118-Isochrysis_galbana.AAC.2